MTSTKRHQPIVFALVCALVLIGGSLKAHAANLGIFNPKVTSTTGEAKSSNKNHSIIIEYEIEAMSAPYASTTLDICGKFEHRLKTSGYTKKPCGPDDLEDKGSGKYKATWYIPIVSQYGTICNTDASMKVKVLGVSGDWIHSDWTDSENVSWGAC